MYYETRNMQMRDIGVEKFYIELIELFPCNSKEELVAREQYYIRLYVGVFFNSREMSWRFFEKNEFFVFGTVNTKTQLDVCQQAKKDIMRKNLTKLIKFRALPKIFYLLWIDELCYFLQIL